MTGGRAGACALWHRREPENGEAQGQEGAGRSWARRRAPCPTASCAAAAAHVAPPLPPRPCGTRRAAGRAMQWWRCANVDSGCAAVAWHDGRFQTGGTSAQRPQPARSSRPVGAISACHAAAAWLDEAHWDDASPNLHRAGDQRVPCAAVERHELEVRCGHGSATASGGIGRCSPGQPVVAWPSFGARRMQQAQVGADSCAARARPCWDHAPQESRRSRGDPWPWRAALRQPGANVRYPPICIRREA